MNKQDVRNYLDQVDDDVDLVVLPRKVLNLIRHKNIGLSAMTIIQHLTGVDLLEGEPKDHPKTRSDFIRCARLLRDFPELRERLPKMARVSPEWANLVSRWNEIEADLHNPHLAELQL